MLPSGFLTTGLDQVKTAYKQIAQDNETIRKNARPTKRSTFDPSELTWTPRKRHNSRWPVIPPTWDAMIAEWQPLIVFEIDISEIDDPAFWEQEHAITLEESGQVNFKRSKRSKKRRSVVQRPSLSTISEERKEPSGVPAEYRPMYSAPSKRWSAAAEKYFTMTATPAGVTDDDGEGDENSIVITNERGHFRVPSSPLSSQSATTSASKGDTQGHVEATNERGHFRVPSSPLSSRSATTETSNRGTQGPVEVTNERGRFCVPSTPSFSGPATTAASDRKRKAQNEHIEQRTPARRRSMHHESSASQSTGDSTPMAIFDQPTPNVHAEPEHETKRRVSLDNARRSDRPLQMTAFKKVRTWVTTTFNGRRRSFAEAMDEQEGQDEPPRTRRRHTLDVDVGRNPDIFGQTASHERGLPPDTNALPSTTPATNFVGSGGGARKIDDRARNLFNTAGTLAAQEDCLSEVPSEFSMARNAIRAATAAALDTTAISPEQKKVGVQWNAITNVDDKIRDLLDRKAALVFGKDDYGNTISSDEDDMQLFEETIANRIRSVLEPDEDEDMTVGDLGIDALAPKLPVATPSATEAVMADSLVAIVPALDSTMPDSAMPDPPTAMEATVETASTTAVVDEPVSRELELAALQEPLDASEHDVVKTTTVESTAMIDASVPGELDAASQPLEVSDDDSHAATIIDPSNMGHTTISDEPATLPQSTEATVQNLATPTAEELMPDAPLVEQPTMVSQPDETADSQLDVNISPAPTAQLQTVEAKDADSNDDSQLELLHSFVRRAQMKPKRRESMTLFTGSPRAQIDTSTVLKSPRQPLAQKDANMSPIPSKTNMSPSPSKKRKLKEAEEAPLDMTKNSRLVKPDLDDTTPQPLRKRRRKGAENDSPDEIFNPEMALSQSLTQRGSSGGPRRSKRVTPKPTEPVTSSHIPVRLPGSFDADIPAVSTAGLMQRKTEKDLATLTRTNTRRNKGAALTVPARLAGLSLPADTADPFISPEKASKLRASRGKAVRWDETLARFQGDDDSAPPVATISPPVPAAVPAVVEEPTTTVPASAPASVTTPVPASAPAAFSAPAPAESEKKKALRPRPSRLPAAVTKTTTTPKAPKTPKARAASTPSRITPTPTRRSSAVGARLGTPAAKRRGSAKR